MLKHNLQKNVHVQRALRGICAKQHRLSRHWGGSSRHDIPSEIWVRSTESLGQVITAQRLWTALWRWCRVGGDGPTLGQFAERHHGNDIVASTVDSSSIVGIATRNEHQRADRARALAICIDFFLFPGHAK